LKQFSVCRKLASGARRLFRASPCGFLSLSGNGDGTITIEDGGLVTTGTIATPQDTILGE
jgi:hypothetical protein